MPLLENGYDPSKEQIKWMDQCLYFLKGDFHNLSVCVPRRRGKTVFLCKLALSNEINSFNVVFLVDTTEDKEVVKTIICELNGGGFPDSLKILKYSELNNITRSSSMESYFEDKFCFLADEGCNYPDGSLERKCIGYKGDKLISLGTLSE